MPVLAHEGDIIVASLKVEPEAQRQPAQAIGKDLDLATLDTAGGGLTPGGVADIPRRLQQSLSIRKGEWSLDSNIGSQIAEYASDFGYELLPKLIALEVARLSFVRFSSRDEDPSLSFIRKVASVKIPENRPEGEWLPVAFELDVEGVGPWKGTVRVFVGTED